MCVNSGFGEVYLLDDGGIFEIRFDSSDEGIPSVSKVLGDGEGDQNAQDTNRNQELEEGNPPGILTIC